MADDIDGNSQLEELLKCVICLDRLTDDRMLPCSHMFCLECLQGLAKCSMDILCPECRAKHKVPLGGVSNFPRNIRLKQFLDQLCGDCAKNPKAETCPHCNKSICTQCQESHMVELRGQVAQDITKIDKLDDASVLKEIKKEKKVLKDKEKLLDKEITKAADDLVDVIRNQEKKLKSDLKHFFQRELKQIESKEKEYVDRVNQLKQFRKKTDVTRLLDSKLMEVKWQWPAYQATLDELQKGIKFSGKQKDVHLHANVNEVDESLKRNLILRGVEVDGRSLSVSSQDQMSSGLKPRDRKGSSPRMQVSVIGSSGHGLGQLDSPFGVTVSPTSKHLVVADTQNNRIQVFNTKGDVVTSFGSKGNGINELNHPIGVAVMKDSNYVVTDTNNHRIKIFSSDGRFVRTFGKQGTGVGEFQQPWGVATDAKDFIFITDCENNRVQVLTNRGTFVRMMGERLLTNPTGIAVDKNGDVYVADCENHRIQVFSSAGLRKLTIGREGTAQGCLSYPDGLALDHQGNITVGEWGNHRVQVFSKTGQSIRMIGKQGNGSGQFDQPRGVSVLDDGRIVISDCGNDRLQLI